MRATSKNNFCREEAKTGRKNKLKFIPYRLPALPAI